MMCLGLRLMWFMASMCTRGVTSRVRLAWLWVVTSSVIARIVAPVVLRRWVTCGTALALRRMAVVVCRVCGWTR